MKQIKNAFWTIIFIMLASFVCAAQEISVQDLRVSDLNPAVNGTTANLKFNLTNSGNETATDFNYTINITGQTLRTRLMPFLAAGANMPQTVPVVISSTGTLNATIMADSANKYSETNEADNTKTITITVALPEKNLTISNAQATANPGAVEANTTFTVSNTGNVDLSGIVLTCSNLTGTNGTITGVQIIGTPASVLTGGAKIVNVKIPTASAAPGIYSGTLKAEVSGINKTSAITLTVKEPVSNVTVSGDLKLSGDWGDSASDSITIKNEGGAAETLNFTLSFTGMTVNMSETGFALKAGEERALTLSTKIPNNADAKDYEGVISIKGTKTNLILPVIVEVTGSKLNIDEVKISMDNSSYKEFKTSGMDIAPGAKIDFKVTLENLLSDNDEQLSNPEVTVTIDGNDWEEDQTEESEDIDGKDSVDLEITGMRADSGVEDGDEYSVTITAEAEDDDGRMHTAKWTGTLTIQQENEDLRITELSVGSKELSPGETTRLRLEVTSYGAKDMSDVKIKVFSTALGISESWTVDMDKAGDADDQIAKSIDVIIPSTAAITNYTIKAEVYNNDNDRMDDATVSIKITNDAGNQDVQNDVVIQPVKTQTNTTQAGVSASGGSAIAQETTKQNFRDTSAYVVILAVGMIAVIGAGVFMIWKFW